MSQRFDINQQAPKSGRMIKEDNTLINEADLIGGSVIDEGGGDYRWKVQVDVDTVTATNVTITNFPTEYALPAAQVTALQSVNAAQDGSWSVSVDNLPTDYATAAKQLPDNHQVTVSNQITQPTTPADTQPVSGTVSVSGLQTDALTNAELRAADVAITLDGEEVALTRGDSQATPLFVGWSGSQQVTVSGSVSVVTQGANRLSVDAAQDGEWAVSVNNLPTEYPLPATQVATLTPQTDALTDSELRASPIAVENLTQLVPEQYDEIALSYTGDDLTGVVYKAATVTVATLTLGYTGGKLTSVVRS